MSNRFRALWLGCLWLAGLMICLGIEWVRHTAGLGQLPPTLRWCGDFLFDTPMYLTLFLVAPLCWWLRTGVVLHRRDLLKDWTFAWAEGLKTPGQLAVETTSAKRRRRTGAVTRKDWVLAIAIGMLSLGTSYQVGHPLEKLPPAYHDEYSYLFQAKTLLAGRLSFPSHPEVAPIFDQIHVVNQGQLASRYYPGTGAWLAPWVALGRPLWGHWLAGACVAMLLFWIGRRLGGTGLGTLAGALTAVSPGLALFSNLLLAHHPTLLGLAIFLHGFVYWMTDPNLKSADVSPSDWDDPAHSEFRMDLNNVNQTASIGNPWRLLEAGIGLSFAMLCRPATAAGFALPFGIWFVWWLLTASRFAAIQRLLCLSLLGLPILAGWSVMAVYNHSITGAWNVSPYQLYTDVYTPRHVYGFDNVRRGTAALAGRELPLVTRNYDAWAQNLDAELAVRNVEQRLLASFRWTLGLIPLVLILLAACGLTNHGARDSARDLAWRMIFISMISLHAIHVPYWFDGIMHWHYVFESSILLLLLFARGVARLAVYFYEAKRPWMLLWLVTLIGTAVTTNHVAFAPYWETRLASGIAELKYSKRIYADFRRRIETEVTSLPALVLVIPDASDRHMDFVSNDPDLNAAILFGRLVPNEVPLESIERAFPERQIYLYDAKTRDLRQHRRE